MFCVSGTKRRSGLCYPDLLVTLTGPPPLVFRVKMAEYVNIVRRALGQIGGHGGVKGLLVQLFRYSSDTCW